MSRIHSVRESLVIHQTREKTWAAGNDPRRLSSHVPMLRSFAIKGKMRVGAPVREVHTVLGYPQRFEGQVTAFEPGKHWAMVTRPVTWGPAGLPHSADYRFESSKDGAATKVSVSCDYELLGLLRLPGASWLTAIIMRMTIRKLLRAIEKQALRQPS